MGSSEDSVLLESLLVAGAVCAALVAQGASGKDKLVWQQHVARFFGAGLLLLFAGSLGGWTIVMVAGMLMFAPMTLVAVGGLLYVFDDAVRGFRKR